MRKQRAGSLVEAASLSAVDLFRELPSTCLKTLERKSVVRDFNSGHVFFRTHDAAQVLFLLEKGRVQTFRTNGRKKLIIAELKPPAIFGEMGFVGQCMYHCQAQATELSRIRTISRKDLEAVLERHPVVTRRLLDLVGERFVHVLLDLEATSSRQLIPRLANLLLSKSQADCVCNMTHRDIAEHLHVYRESATSALGELRQAGIVAIERKRIRILDRARLERAARE